MDAAFQAHPVPQNVTNFEFHLVGDMTLKQFGYLAVGLVLAFVTFVGIGSSIPLLAWPLIIIFAGVGAAFAFIPIQERPLDHWVGAFFNAIFKPTRLKYSSKVLKAEDPLFPKRLSAYFRTHTGAPAPDPAFTEPEQIVKSNMPENLTARKPTMADRLINARAEDKQPSLQIPPISIRPIQATPLPPVTPKAPAPIKKPEAPKETMPMDLKKTVELAKEAQETQKQIVKIEQQISQIKQQASQPGVDPRFYIEQFQDLLTDLTKLNKNASDAAHNLAVVSNMPTAPQTTIPTPPTPEPLAIAKSMPSVSLTTFPNIINGIVTDTKGNYIEGAVIVAHDKQGLPVRALKSNKLGQFVAATPLSNGTFSIVVEKENLSFDKVSVELKGEILSPILLSAKRMAVG